MKLCQFYLSASQRDADLAQRLPRRARLGIIDNEQVVPLLLPTGEPTTGVDLPTYLEVIDGAIGDAPKTSDEKYGLESVFLAPPVVRPRAFLDFYTFEQHVRTCRAKRGLDVVPEWYKVPAYYNSNTSALYGHGQLIPFPPQEDRLDYELELACIIGKRCRNVDESEADQVIVGYTILNDWSARSMQIEVMTIGLGPARGKDHASSLGPHLVTKDELPDILALGMRAFVNGELWSEGISGSAHYSFAQMIAYASQARTLFPGDIIGSGTVGSGCGFEQDRFLHPGDRVRLEIEGLGVLENEIFYEMPVQE